MPADLVSILLPLESVNFITSSDTSNKMHARGMMFETGGAIIVLKENNPSNISIDLTKMTVKRTSLLQFNSFK